MATNYSKAYADYMNERNEQNRKATIDALVASRDANIAQANNMKQQSNDKYNALIKQNEVDTERARNEANENYQSMINQNQVDKYQTMRRYREMFGGDDSGMSRSNLLYVNSKYGNQDSSIKSQRQKYLEQLQADSEARRLGYENDMRNYANSIDAQILGYNSDYYNNLARVNAQYDANYLPWYEEEPVYSGGGSGRSSLSSSNLKKQYASSKTIVDNAQDFKKKMDELQNRRKQSQGIVGQTVKAVKDARSRLSGLSNLYSKKK